MTTKLRIIKDTRYSSGQWRVVDESGEAINVPQRFDHPQLGATVLSMPLCRDTKEKLIEDVLDLLVLQVKKIKELQAEPQ